MCLVKHIYVYQSILRAVPSCIVAFRMLTQGANPCENLQCGPGQDCDIDRYGIATCRCTPGCEPVMRPVCGQDGNTYHSRCDMRRSGCEMQKAIELHYRGACGEICLVFLVCFGWLVVWS